MSKQQESATTPFDGRVAALEEAIAAQYRIIEAAQEQLRADPLNPDLRRAVQDAKLPMFQLTNDLAFYARAKSETLGGKSYSVPA